MWRYTMLVFFSVQLSACMTFTVEGDLPKTPGSTTGNETVHGSLYGIEWSDHVVEKCGNREGITRVRFHTNAAYLVASVASLGLYVPQNVTWWCDGTPSEEPEDDIYIPGGGN